MAKSKNMNILIELFGSDTKVKLMRMFLFNVETVFTMDEMIDRTKSKPKDVRAEVKRLESIGLIKNKQYTKEVTVGRGKKQSVKKVQVKGFALEPKFPYLNAVKTLLITVSLHADDSLLKRFNNVGRIKLFIASGVFIQEWDTRADLLIVGDDLSLSKIESVISNIESEVGKEITYAAFETSEFEYRLGIHDKLVRDILDFPHTTLLDRIGIEPEKVV